MHMPSARHWYLIAPAILAIALAWYFFEKRSENDIPSTGALLHGQSSQTLIVPKPVQSPSLVVGEKTKLYMSDESYLFGAQPNLSSIPLHRDPSYRLGLGHKFQHTSGAVFTGELSVSTINIEANSGVASSSDKPNQARLSTKYLAPLGTNSGLSAGLTTDIGNRQIWSTLELGMSLNLKDNLSLNLNHDYGKSISSGDVLHQTGIALEKKF